MKTETQQTQGVAAEETECSDAQAQAFLRRCHARFERPEARKARIAHAFASAGYRVKKVELEKIHPLWWVVMYVAEPIRAARREEVEERIRAIMAELSENIDSEGSPVLIDGKRIQVWFTWSCPYCMGMM